MEIVAWIAGTALLLLACVYGAIGIALLLAHYRMTHVPAAGRQPVAAPADIPDLRYRVP